MSNVSAAKPMTRMATSMKAEPKKVNRTYFQAE